MFWSYGEKKTFCIQAQFVFANLEWLYGRIQIWVGGIPLGDERALVNLRSIRSFAREMIEDIHIPPRVAPESVISRSLGFSKPKTEGVELEVIGGASLLNRGTITLVGLDDNNDFLVGQSSSEQGSIGVVVKAGYVGEVIDQFCDWVEHIPDFLLLPVCLESKKALPYKVEVRPNMLELFLEVETEVFAPITMRGEDGIVEFDFDVNTYRIARVLAKGEFKKGNLRLRDAESTEKVVVLEEFPTQELARESKFCLDGNWAVVMWRPTGIYTKCAAGRVEFYVEGGEFVGFGVELSDVEIEQLQN